MRALVSWCLQRRPVVLLAALLILVAGAIGATQLRQQFFPDVDFPFVITTLEVQGLDAEAVDEQVAKPIEEAARNLEDAETTQTVATEGRVTLVTELSYGTDTSQFEEDLARELGGVELPAGAGEPDIGGGFDEQAALNAALSTNGSLTKLTEDAEDVRDDLEQIDGVGRVELDGGVKKEYEVELKRRAVRRGQTPAALAKQIQSSVREAPVGLVERRGSRTPLLVDPGTVSGERELEQLPISSKRELSDVANVRRQSAEGTGFARTNGRPSIALSVYPEEDADQVQVVEDSEAALARAEDRLHGVDVNTIFETASDVRASVRGLLLEGALGAFFAVIVIFMFLRSVRPTLVAAVSIPTSIVFGLLAAWMLGLTLNIITLAGLTIAIGRVIDDAIVVLENVYKHLERGEPRTRAALDGTSEVANAIVSSTLATAAVFLPLGLVGGLISEIFFSFSIIVVVALLASLLVAVTVIPVLGAMFMRPRGRERAGRPVLAAAVAPITRFGIRPLGRVAVIGAAFLALIGTIAAVAGGGIPVQFLPDSGTQQAFGSVDLPAGVSPARAERLLEPLEDRLENTDGVESAQVTFGGAGVQTDEVEDTENGAFFANFKEGVDVNRVVADLRRFGERRYPEGFTADRLEQGPPAGEFEATVVGDDQADAERAARRVTRLLKKRDDIAQVDNEAANEQTQLVLEVDEDERGTEDQRRASEALAAVVASVPAGTVGDDDTPVVVRAPSSLLKDAEALEEVPLGPRASDAAAAGVPPQGGQAGAPPPGGMPAGAVPRGGAPPRGAPPGGPPQGGRLPGGRPPSERPGSGEAAPTRRPHCSNGVDDDSDARTDFPADPNCTSERDTSEAPADPPRCSDGRDNDRDGRTDFGDDPDCVGPRDDSEAETPSAAARLPLDSQTSTEAIIRRGESPQVVRGRAGKRGRARGRQTDGGGSGGASARDAEGTGGAASQAAGGSGGGAAAAVGASGAGAGAAAAGVEGAGAGTGGQGAGAAAAGAGAAAAGGAPSGAGAAGASPGAGGPTGAPVTALGAGAPGAPSARPRGKVGDVGQVKRQRAPGTRSRVDGEPAVRVNARILGADVNAINQSIQRDVDELDLTNARVELGGDQEFINQMFSDLGLAILAAIVLVYLVLVIFFGSTSQPVTILAPVLFSSIGSLLALYVTDAALGLPAMIGQLLLIGIVVANSILLVDTALRSRRAGVARDEALVTAAKLRVRPVLMTALATIAALLPLAAGFSGEGGIISQSLGAVVIGGLLTATLLTLVIVPAVFATFDGAGRALAHTFGRNGASEQITGDGAGPAGEHPSGAGLAPDGAPDGDRDGQTGEVDGGRRGPLARLRRGSRS